MNIKVINVTLPDEKQNYIHRIGRVGRADRMGLAISLVSKVQEKVWYHTCPSRGKSCNNRLLREEGGCCIWYNEMHYLDEIEEHLGWLTIKNEQIISTYLMIKILTKDAQYHKYQKLWIYLLTNLMVK